MFKVAAKKGENTRNFNSKTNSVKKMGIMGRVEHKLVNHAVAMSLVKKDNSQSAFFSVLKAVIWQELWLQLHKAPGLLGR